MARADEDATAALNAEEYIGFAHELRTCMQRLLADTALEAGMGRFREAQGVGIGGFKGIWVRKAGAATRARYMTALRGVAADVRAAAEEMERADTPHERRVAAAAVRAAMAGIRRITWQKVAKYTGAAGVRVRVRKRLDHQRARPRDYGSLRPINPLSSFVFFVWTH